MGQQGRPGPAAAPPAILSRLLNLLLPAISLAAVCGCDRSPAPAAPPATTRTSGPAPATAPITAASLSPAATDIIIRLGLGDRLVAVSNFDRPQPRTKNLPRVGDYQSTDWEQLAALHPSIMITQFGPGRTPPGLEQKAAGLNIQLVNVSITRLNDIVAAMTTLADALGEPGVGRERVAGFRSRLRAIGRVSTGRRVRALIVVSDDARAVAGRGNYLDDALTLAGGDNVIGPESPPYPQIDHEMLLRLDPEVIFQLMPSPSPQVRDSAARVWRSMPQLAAVKNDRVVTITAPGCLSPSQLVVETAETFQRTMRAVRDGTPLPGDVKTLQHPDGADDANKGTE